MEDDLDRIAAGEQERVDWLRHFYFGGGDGDEGLHALVSDLSEIDARAVNSLPLGDSGIVLRVGRYGPYVERGEERASVPEDMAPDELTVEKARGAALGPVRRPRARHAPGVGHRDRGQGRPLRPVRDRGAARGRDREAAHGLALPVDVARDGDARGGGAAAVAAASAGRRPGRRRRGDGPERPLRPVREEGHRIAVARERGAAVHDLARGRARAAREAEGATRPRAGRSRRCASSAPTRSAASRSCSRRAVSAPT